jgi:hypothetical protein
VRSKGPSENAELCGLEPSEPSAVGPSFRTGCSSGGDATTGGAGGDATLSYAILAETSVAGPCEEIGLHYDQAI